MSTKFSVSELNLYYGNFHALKNINMEIPDEALDHLGDL